MNPLFCLPEDVYRKIESVVDAYRKAYIWNYIKAVSKDEKKKLL